METTNQNNQIYGILATSPMDADFSKDMPQSNKAENHSTYEDGEHAEYYGDIYYSDHVYEIFEFETPLYGYLWPVFVLYTAFCNIVVVGGFFHKRMRNPTTIILVAIAISDSLTGLVTLPATFHIFTDSNWLLSKQWCETAMITRYFISRAFHTVSVWQTLLLGVHGILSVRNPVIASRFCTMRKTIGIICTMYVLSVGLHIYHTTDIKAEHGMCQWSIEEPCKWTCVYIWGTLLLTHLIPSIVLVVLAVCMVRALRQIDNRVTIPGNTTCKKKEKTKRVALVVVLIVVIFLVPELPYGLFYLTTVSLRHSKRNIFPLRTNRLIHCIYEFLLTLSFHINFWVYCVMFRGFRNCVKRLLSKVTCHRITFKRLECEATSSEKDLELNGVTNLSFDETKLAGIPS